MWSWSVRLHVTWHAYRNGGAPHLADDIAMASAIVSVLVVALLVGVIVLLKWRLSLTVFRRRNLAHAGAARGHVNEVFPFGVHALSSGGLSLFRGNSLGGGPASPRITKEQRAEAFLRRILALTGATKADGAYILNVGKVQFQLRDRFIRRLQNPQDPKSPYEETCFYLVHNGMPKVEEIATALLHLSNNPGLFDKWALQNGVAFKADGKIFDRCPLMGLR
ncbi:MAG TPA: hypothetical protein VJN92_10405 [Candidatus Acidoferrum sp.]|nr:hypothetical protein [Candidatus Acidoferrum sp.]